jgi:hypothetical protein
VGDSGQLALGEQLGPADGTGDADPRQVVALEVDDHHVLGGVLLRLDRDARGTRPLDRRGTDDRAAFLQQELGRRGDDRPAVALERRRLERPQRSEGGSERERVTAELGPQVLDEVHLVDVALVNRVAHRLDRGCVGRRAPGLVPLAGAEPASRRRGPLE